MRLAKTKRAWLALMLGVAIVGCDSSTVTHSDGGTGRDSRNTEAGLADGLARSDGPGADAWLAQDDGLATLEDVLAAKDGTLVTDGPGGALTPDGQASSDDTLPPDGPAHADSTEDVLVRTDGTDGRNDGTNAPEGPTDGQPRKDGPAGPELPAPPDGPRTPDAPAGPEVSPPPDLPPPSPDSTGANQVTIAIVGDTAEKGRTSHTRAVASLISGHSPSVTSLFIAGDCVRYDGSGTLLSFFQKYWEPASEGNMGQFNNIVFPQLGNHEYLEDKAQGYFDYFATRLAAIADLPSYHGDADTVDRGWYSVDMNGWHIVSLNANCDEISGGCSTGGAEEKWLSADLADHTGMPTIAIWHEPLWTCTTDGHSPETDVLPLWAKLYDAHADFVFNGHNHLYQRYKPLNKASSGTEDQAAGITEIIVGTGGSSTYHACSSSQDTRVAKALDGDGSLGAMFFTMGSDGSYSWAFRLKSDGSIFDSGSGRSHNAK
jgi:hypothetical protein